MNKELDEIVKKKLSTIWIVITYRRKLHPCDVFIDVFNDVLVRVVVLFFVFVLDSCGRLWNPLGKP